jgi:hypothetical protein
MVYFTLENGGIAQILHGRYLDEVVEEYIHFHNKWNKKTLGGNS